MKKTLTSTTSHSSILDAGSEKLLASKMMLPGSNRRIHSAHQASKATRENLTSGSTPETTMQSRTAPSSALLSGPTPSPDEDDHLTIKKLKTQHSQSSGSHPDSFYSSTSSSSNNYLRSSNTNSSCRPLRVWWWIRSAARCSWPIGQFYCQLRTTLLFCSYSRGYICCFRNCWATYQWPCRASYGRTGNNCRTSHGRTGNNCRASHGRIGNRCIEQSSSTLQRSSKHFSSTFSR